MPRPKTKEELLDYSDLQYERLMNYIESLDDEVKYKKFKLEDRDKNLRDIIVHLYEWHILLLNWIDSNINGKKKHFLPEEYTWKTYPKMNLEIWKKHQETPLLEAFKLLKASHEKVRKVIVSFNNEELFTKKYYDWTGTTSLGSYCVSSTSSHYDWAYKKFKKMIKLG